MPEPYILSKVNLPDALIKKYNRYAKDYLVRCDTNWENKQPSYLARSCVS